MHEHEPLRPRRGRRGLGPPSQVLYRGDAIVHDARLARGAQRVAEPLRRAGRCARGALAPVKAKMNLFSGMQVFLDGKAPKSFLIDPSASPERFLLLMNFAATAQIAGVPLEIVSVPGKAPEEATDKSVAPPIALDISPAAMR